MIQNPFKKKNFINAYLFFLERLVLKLFKRPDIAVRSVCNTLEPTPERVVSNFTQGIYLSGRDIHGGLMWGSDAERAVITRDSARIQKRLKQYMKKNIYKIRYDERFEEVIRETQRTDEWTWINEPLIEVYLQLHELGFARSVEAYKDAELVGGIWGIQVGRTYSIMSMFHRANHAGSILVGTLVQMVQKNQLTLLDCVRMNRNFKRFGAIAVPVEEFVERVVQSMEIPDLTDSAM